MVRRDIENVFLMQRQLRKVKKYLNNKIPNYFNAYFINKKLKTLNLAMIFWKLPQKRLSLWQDKSCTVTNTLNTLILSFLI